MMKFRRTPSEGLPDENKLRAEPSTTPSSHLQIIPFFSFYMHANPLVEMMSGVSLYFLFKSHILYINYHSATIFSGAASSLKRYSF